MHLNFHVRVYFCVFVNIFVFNNSIRCLTRVMLLSSGTQDNFFSVLGVNDDIVTVDFKEFSGWEALVSEVELVKSGVSVLLIINRVKLFD